MLSRHACLALGTGVWLLTLPTGASAQVSTQATVTGRVTSRAGEPIAGAQIELEGLSGSASSDSLGRFRLTSIPPGTYILAARRLGYAPTRQPISLRDGETAAVTIVLAETALRLETVRVTADAVGRARGELGTADVIGRDAIANQSATSLRGVLELIPNVPLSAPGLDGVQQIGLRTVPNSSGGIGGGGAASDLASFGTLVVLDGAPLSNNANLQTTGPRGELSVASSAGGGVDLRSIPASTLERVEVIRGIPSSRYGDLTQGVIVVERRAGAFDPEIIARYDPRTAEASLAGGRELGRRHIASATTDVARTLTAPGLREDQVFRGSVQLAHRFQSRAPDAQDDVARLTLDSRIEFTQLYANTPENPAFIPGFSTWTRDNRLRLIERARFRLGGSGMLEWTAAFDRTRQKSFVQGLRIRGGMPFTEALTEGRNVGRFVIGQYSARVDLDGTPYSFYSRLEATVSGPRFGADHVLRTGLELRREWNSGAGYQFDIEFPPQSTFNGVEGFDRPRRYDALPPLVTSSWYVDDRLRIPLGAERSLDAQLGVRLDLLHDGSQWGAGIRDAVLQPRVNAIATIRPWLRLRGGYGEAAKTPDLGSLSPAPQYFDVVNVNWFTTDPAERLAILTTFLRDPTNPDLGFAVGRKLELGIEADFPAGASLALTAFSDETFRGIGMDPRPAFITRDHYQLTDSTIGTGQPPMIIEPPSFTDTVPILIQRPSNNRTLRSRGLELIASLPEIPGLRTRIEANGAWIASRYRADAIVFGGGTAFSDMQLNPDIARAPYYHAGFGTGERVIMTYRAVHHQPELGFVATVTVQHTFHEKRRDIGETDTLAFEGYITRDARLIPVPPADRTLPQYADLRRPRTGLLITSQPAPGDWLLSFQVSKSIGAAGRLSLYAFNAFDRPGQPAITGRTPRLYPNLRYGVELTLPLARSAR